MCGRTDRALSAGLLTVVLALILALTGSGCVALMVPSLAYEGYKYEKKSRNEPAKKPYDSAAAAPKNSGQTDTIE